MATSIRPLLPELNFITIHYASFILVTLVASLVFWGSATPSTSISFTDSLFLTLSALSNTGLNPVNLSDINTWQQALLFLLMIIGSPILISIIVLIVRLRAFENAFVELRRERREKKRRGTGFTSWFGPRGSTKPRNFPRDGGFRNRLSSDMLDGYTPKYHVTTGRDIFGQTSREDIAPDAIAQTTTSESNANDQASDITEHRGRPTEAHLNVDRPQCPSLSPAGRDSEHEGHAQPGSTHVAFTDNAILDSTPRTERGWRRPSRPLFLFTGVGASAHQTLHSRSTFIAEEARRIPSRPSILPNIYDQTRARRLTSTGWISRNSQFHGLTVEDRHRLGGNEYRAVVFLSFLIPCYLILWQALGALALGAYVNNTRQEVANENGLNAWWVGSFNAVSAFSNSGMSLLDANMVAFRDSAFMLLSMSLFILAGNTAYPIFLRGAVWVSWKILPGNATWCEDRHTLRFLLDHPRRVYTNMFPSRHTWWLAASLVVLNVIDWAFFELLSIGDHDIQVLPEITKVLGGLFQAFAVRSGGFYVVPIPNLRLGLQFLYLIMMYISVYPVTMTMRNSNVYEERSLGIFSEDLEIDKHNAHCLDDVQQPGDHPQEGRIAGIKRRMTQFAEAASPAPKREARSYFMRQQLRAQLAHDAWFAVLAIFFVFIIENAQLERDPIHFSAFNVIFEVISAYSTVGLSVGVASDAYSFSGSWHMLSKLILCGVMLRGRHRGLPVAIDHAIQLPGQRLWDAEDEDGERRMDKAGRTLAPYPSLQEKGPTTLVTDRRPEA